MRIPTSFNRMGLALKPTPSPIPVDENDYLRFTANVDNSAVKVTKNGSPPDVVLEYSTDKQTWNNYTVEDVIELNTGDKVYFRGNNNAFAAEWNQNYNKFAMSGSIAADGNTMSLLDKTCQKTSLPRQGFYRLFDGCTSLTTPPKLPATSLGQNCYGFMFSACSNLSAAPELPASNLSAGQCYYYMFKNCTSLTTPPILSAMTLGNQCYARMFENCSNLSAAPELPAMELKYHCYEGMFRSCSKLSSVILPAEELVEECYYIMFQYCSALSSVEVGFDDWKSDINATNGWLETVALSGTLHAPASLIVSTRGGNTIPYYWNKVNTDDSELYIEAVQANTNVKLDHSGEYPVNENAGHYEQGEGWYEEQEPIYHPAETHWDDELQEEVTDMEEWWEDQEPIYHEGEETWVQDYEPIVVNVEYSTDRVNWQTYTIGDTIALSGVGDRVYFRGDNASSFSTENGYYYFTTDNQKQINVGGNIMSLLDTTMQLSAVPVNAFKMMFYQTAVLNAKKLILPATTVSQKCYNSMFDGCTSLITSPKILPATNLLYAYSCYSAMFAGCVSLTTTPILPASTYIESYCYEMMFTGCTSLTKAPALPADEVGDNAYQDMFNGCTSLTEAPELPATQISYGCYYNMFRGCTSLTDAPELPATYAVTFCYLGMFSDCTSLSSAPELKATDLNDYQARACYLEMFNGCTSLSTAPIISATTLYDESMKRMFQGCSNLNEVTVNFTDWNENDYATLNWLSGVAANGTFNCPSNLDTTTRDASHVPDGWTVAAS